MKKNQQKENRFSSNIEVGTLVKKSIIKNEYVKNNKTEKKSITDQRFFDCLCFPNISKQNWNKVKEVYLLTSPISKLSCLFLSKNEDNTIPVKIMLFCFDFYPTFQHFSREACFKYNNIITINLYNQIKIEKEQNETTIKNLLKNYKLSRQQWLSLYYFYENEKFKYKISTESLQKFGAFEELEKEKIDNILFL